MDKESIDPVYKYVDDKIKLVRRELRQLKVAHDAVAHRHQEDLLISSRYITKELILIIARQTRDIIYREKPNIDNHTIIQLFADAKSSRTEIDKSDNPLLLSARFGDKCDKLLRDLGIKLIVV